MSAVSAEDTSPGWTVTYQNKTGSVHLRADFQALASSSFPNFPADFQSQAKASLAALQTCHPSLIKHGLAVVRSLYGLFDRDADNAANERRASSSERRLDSRLRAFAYGSLSGLLRRLRCRSRPTTSDQPLP